MKTKPKVLIVVEFFLPGYKSGGPAQSILSITKHLSNKIDFYILTSDRDFGDRSPYTNIKFDTWLQFPDYKIKYTNKKKAPNAILKSIIKENISTIYFNSFFNFYYSILPLLLIQFQPSYSINISIAPRGEFDTGALAIKSSKKKGFLMFTKLFPIYRKSRWHATNKIEFDRIKKLIQCREVFLAPVIVSEVISIPEEKLSPKETGVLKCIFLSRISEKKNLLGALKIVSKIKFDLVFHIFGPIDDEGYWQKCKNHIDLLPKNVRVEYKGHIHHDNVSKTFQSYHIFLFPTFGENFGHVIFEALASGCIPLISDQTPWSSSISECGWSIPLNQPMIFSKKLEQCFTMSPFQFRERYLKTFDIARQYFSNSSTENNYINLFR